MPGAGPASTPSSASVPQGVDGRPEPVPGLVPGADHDVEGVPPIRPSQPAECCSPLKGTDPAITMPDHDLTAVRSFLGFCNGLLVGVALEIDRTDNSSFTIAEKE